MPGIPEPEPWKAEVRRRLGALEAHITDLEERLNDRGVFSGDGVCTVPGDPAHLWEGGSDA